MFVRPEGTRLSHHFEVETAKNASRSASRHYTLDLWSLMSAGLVIFWYKSCWDSVADWFLWTVKCTWANQYLTDWRALALKIIVIITNIYNALHSKTSKVHYRSSENKKQITSEYIIKARKVNQKPGKKVCLNLTFINSERKAKFLQDSPPRNNLVSRFWEAVFEGYWFVFKSERARSW